MFRTLIAFSFTLALVSPFVVSASALENLHNETEVGAIVVTGNASTKTLNVRQRTDFAWGEKHDIRFEGQYLNGHTGPIETVRRWLLGLRYGHRLDERKSVFVGQNVESDVFAGIDRQYNTDVGLRYLIGQTEAMEWHAEAGYRFQSEEPTVGSTSHDHLARLYTELNYRYSEFVLAKTDFEYLPNFSDSDDYDLIGEVALYTALSSILSFKTGYEVRYRSVLAGAARERTDTLFTTALVAKF